MELRLQQLITDLERVSNVRNLDANNPIKFQIAHPTNATTHVIVASLKEPNTLILPLNVTWFVYDPLSPYYGKALRRVSKDESSEYIHTWALVETMDDVFVNQYYDAADEAQLGDTSMPPPAQVGVAGIARLSHPAQVSSNPIVVSNTDPRLTDARVPLAHSHPQEPAVSLRTANGVVTIGGSAAPVAGATLVATSATTAVWRKLQTSDLA